MADALGIDIIEIERIAGALVAYGERFTNRILGPDERILFDRRADKIQFLAGRFAAKEAIIKGLGRYLVKRPSFKEIQVINDRTGIPAVVWTADLEAQLRGVRCLVSISHSRTNAVAAAIFSDSREA